MTTRSLFRRGMALAVALVMLSLTACSARTAKETPQPAPTDIKISVAAEPVAPPVAPPEPKEAAKPEASPPPITAPAPPTIPAPARKERKDRATAQATQDKGDKDKQEKDKQEKEKAQTKEEYPPVRIRQATSDPNAGSPPAAQSPGRLVVFNFDNADVEIVLQATSELLVFNYVLAPGAKGKKVTVQTTGKIPVDDVFPVLLTILDVNGLAAVRSGNLYRIIPKEGAVQTSTRTIVGPELDPGIPGDQVVTMIIPLKFASAADLANLLRPFIPQQGAATVHRDTNLLVLTDVAANIRRLLDIVKLVDVDVALNELLIIPLKHADANDVAQILTQLFASGRFRPASGQPPAGFAPPQPAQPIQPGQPRQPTAPGAAPDSGAAQERAPLIVPERRSNSLIIYARKQEMDTISRLVEKLDSDIYGGQRIFVYFVENSKARELAATMDAIFGRAGGQAPAQPGTSPTIPSPTGQRGQTGLLTPAQPTTRPTTPYRPGVGGAGGLPGGLAEDLPPGAEIRFIPDEPTNSIIVTTYPRVWIEVEGLLKKLDRMPRQVLIEVLAVEVTLTDDTKLGLAWAVRQGRFDVNFTSFTNTDGGVIAGRPPASIIPFGGSALTGLNFFTFASDKFLAAINLMAGLNRVNVLSAPSIMTAENKKAVINVSRSVPILTSQQVPIGATPSGGTQSIVGTQTVEYKDAGIILTVTPRIGEQGTVALDVKQEVNDVGEGVPPTGSPEFKKREAETSVVLMNNQTLVLGGLIQNKRSIIRTGIPWLMNIPVLGYLFGSKEEKIEKTELLLVITPRVVGTALDAARLTDDVRKSRPDLIELMREFPHIYPVPIPPQPRFPNGPTPAPTQK